MCKFRDCFSCVCTSVYAYHVCVQLSKYVCMLVCNVCIPVCLYSYTSLRMYVRVYVYTYTYVYVQIDTHPSPLRYDSLYSSTYMCMYDVRVVRTLVPMVCPVARRPSLSSRLTALASVQWQVFKRPIPREPNTAEVRNMP